MKLSPPASSSDLEAAREIARRLYQRRRREDRPEMDDDAPARVPIEPPRPTPVPIEPPPLAPVAPPPPPEPPAPSEPPSWDEAVGAAPPAPDAALEAFAGVGELSPDEEPLTDEGMPDLDVEEPGVSPEELIGAGAPEAPPFEHLPETEAGSSSPFEVDLDEAPAEEVVEVPAPPSWDDVVVACLDLAQARGAMLVDPAGQVFAARGEWPEPGPDAIAAKLVATMHRTLQDAPTRAISAPLVGKHLTAWRVSLADGLVTAAFIGDAPVGAEARPAIDTEIRRGAGA